jgi:hypothetical protein
MEFINTVLGLPFKSFGFWALTVQLIGCAIIILLNFHAPPKPAAEAKKIH